MRVLGSYGRNKLDIPSLATFWGEVLWGRYMIWPDYIGYMGAWRLEVTFPYIGVSENSGTPNMDGL